LAHGVREVAAGMTAALVVCTFIGKANAEDQPESTLGNLPEIVVSAQKRDERIQDVPVPMSVVDTQALTESSQVLLRDYAATIPGLGVSPGITGVQTVVLRGITTGGFTTPTTGILVDDVPFGGPGVQSAAIPEIDPGDLARIEVLRGPQGTLYGADSMGGLVKFVTMNPSTSGYSGRFEAGTSWVQNGAEPGFNLRGAANVPLGSTFAVRMSGFQRHDAGYIDNVASNQSGINEAQASGGRLSALWQPSEIFSAKLNALYQRYKTTGSSYIVAGLGDLQNNYLPGVGGAERSTQAYSANLMLKLGTVEVTSVTGYNINDYDSSEDLTPFFGGLSEQFFNVTGAALEERDRSTTFSQELRLADSIGAFDWLAGAFYTYQYAPNHEFSNAIDATTGRNAGQGYDSFSKSRFAEYAGFADVTWNLTDRFKVQVGGRESKLKTAFAYVATGPYAPLLFGADPAVSTNPDEHSSVFNYLFTPSFKVTPDLMVYGRLASGYRQGGSNSPLPGLPPSDYSPDKTQTYEIGAKGDILSHVLTFDASIYYVDWKDIQLTLADPNTGFQYTANGGNAKSQGVELAMTYRPIAGLTLSGWFDYDDAVLKQDLPVTSTALGLKGDRLPFSSRYSGNLSVQDEFPIAGNLTGFVGGVVTYVGDRLGIFGATADRERYPSYTRTDLRAGVRIDSWTVNAYVNNVADSRGVLNGGLGFLIPNSFVYIQPRLIGVNLSKTF